MKIKRVQGTFICIKMIDPNEKTNSGLYLPESAQAKKKTRAVVTHVGPGHYHMGELIPLDIEVGDMVLFTPHSAISQMEDEDGNVFWFMQAHDVIAVIED